MPDHPRITLDSDLGTGSLSEWTCKVADDLFAESCVFRSEILNYLVLAIQSSQKHAFNRTPRRVLEIFVLYYVYGYTTEELASKFGFKRRRSINAVLKNTRTSVRRWFKRHKLDKCL